MLLQFIDLARKAISAHFRYLNAIRELNALTDRELEDLGISRIEIEYAARTSSLKHLYTE
jgi:uncharacterized protein YjiS (DUF1127 family)